MHVHGLLGPFVHGLGTQPGRITDNHLRHYTRGTVRIETTQGTVRTEAITDQKYGYHYYYH